MKTSTNKPPILVFFSIHPWKLTWHWKINHLKMYFLLKMGSFHCHVSFSGVCVDAHVSMSWLEHSGIAMHGCMAPSGHFRITSLAGPVSVRRQYPGQMIPSVHIEISQVLSLQWSPGVMSWVHIFHLNISEIPKFMALCLVKVPKTRGPWPAKTARWGAKRIGSWHPEIQLGNRTSWHQLVPPEV